MADPFEFLDMPEDIGEEELHGDPTAHARLQEVRLAISKAGLKKSGFNTHLNFSYYELGDFMPTAMVEMSRVGLIGIFRFNADKVELAIHCTDAPWDCIAFSLPLASPGKGTWQDIGAAQSYARRYLWQQALELAEADQIDSDASTLREELMPLLTSDPVKAAARFAAAIAGNDELKTRVWKALTPAQRDTLKQHAPKKSPTHSEEN